MAAARAPKSTPKANLPKSGGSKGGKKTRIVRPYCSFSGDTAVATKQGAKAISTIEVGDHVLAYDEARDTTDTYTVTAVLEHEDQVIVHLTIDGELVETTPEQEQIVRILQ